MAFLWMRQNAYGARYLRLRVIRFVLQGAARRRELSFHIR